MCGTCHDREDEAFPSTLKLVLTPETCLVCHTQLENADVEWVTDAAKNVHVTVTPDSPDAADLAVAAADSLTAELRERGFTLDVKTEADLEVSIRVRGRPVREGRFVPRGYSVFRATLAAEVRRPGKKEVLFRRLAVSRPEYARNAKAASLRAVADAWKVLRTHLVEALGSY
jgi:hypothetical protein